MVLEAYYSPRVRWLVDRLSDADARTIRRCVGLLELNPCPDAARTATLVIPYQRVYQNAFRCDGWGIAFHVEQNVFLVIDEIGRLWPPS